MPNQLRHKRVLLKISGEALCPAGGLGIDPQALAATIEEIAPVVREGVQVGLVCGAGNLLRGRQLAGDPHIVRTTADHMGMLATVMNALALRDSLTGHGIDAEILSAIPIPGEAEPFGHRRAVHLLESGSVVVLAGGTGRPFFSTDTCAALRAREIDADVLIKATKVDGVFDKDPAEHPDARKYDRMTYQKVLNDRLGVMDLTAISMCMEGDVPVQVLKLGEPGNLARAVHGEPVGTLITNEN